MSFMWIQSLVNLPPAPDTTPMIASLVGLACLACFALNSRNPCWRVVLSPGVAVRLFAKRRAPAGISAARKPQIRRRLSSAASVRRMPDWAT